MVKLSETEFKYIPEIKIEELKEFLINKKGNKEIQRDSLLLEIAHQLKRIADNLS